MSSPSVYKTKLQLRISDNVDTGENNRRIRSKEPILQLDISKENRKKIDITKKKRNSKIVY